MRIKRLIAGLGASLLLTLGVPLSAVAATTTTVVTPANLAAPPNATTEVSSWYFYNDTSDAASTTETANYRFVTGPSSPPAGFGSLRFINTAATDRYTIATNQFAGDSLSTLNTLSFDMYVPASSSGGTSTTSYLNLDIDFDSTKSGGYQGRLVYVPQGVTTNTWQTFSADSGLLSWSGFANGKDKNPGTADDNKWPDGDTNPLRTLADIKTHFTNAAVWNEGGFTGQLLIKSGHPGPIGLENNVDKVVVNDSIFDFEPDFVVATNKDDCKKGGYKLLSNATGQAFKNQGACVSFVASEGRSQPANKPHF